jgi:hypothetical protein
MKQYLQYPLGHPSNADLINKKAIFCLSLVEYSLAQLQKATQKILTKFNTLDVLLFDSVHRYNLIWQEDLSPDEAHKKARRTGDAWLNHYAVVFQDTAIKMLRWDEWLALPGFAAQRNIAEQLYQNHAGFKQAVDDTALIYLDKYAERAQIKDFAYAKSLSIKVILEESAAILLAASLQYDFDISFRKKPALKYLTEEIIRTAEPHLFQPILVTTHVKNRYKMPH